MTILAPTQIVDFFLKFAGFSRLIPFDADGRFRGRDPFLPTVCLSTNVAIASQYFLLVVLGLFLLCRF